MDEPGWHARWRASEQNAYYNSPSWTGEHVEPVNEPWIGGFSPDPPSGPMGYNTNINPLSPPPPQVGTGYAEPNYRPPAAVPSIHIPGPTAVASQDYGTAITHPGPPLSAVERTNALPRVARMSPHLQFLCGPLLRYDTVDQNGIWRGACMVVTADAGSQYDPHPMMSVEWDSERPARPTQPKGKSHGRHWSTESPLAQKHFIPGHELYVYAGTGGTFTFWRFLMEIPLGPREMGVRYKINGGQEAEFFIPGRTQNMRWAAYSCNGFSVGINQDDFKGPGFSSGYDPVWVDLLEKHEEAPFHVLVGGGDQLYCDVITREPELQEWVNMKSTTRKMQYPMSKLMSFAIDRFFFSHYCLMFRQGAFATANSTIPMANMLDDHDLIDGFGSYPDDLQISPVFRAIGSRGYFFFLLFQCFTTDVVDGTDPRPGTHTFRSTVIGGDGPWIPSPTHSMVTYLGPKVWMLMLDCRGERKKDQVCSMTTYDRVFEQLYRLPEGVEHLVVQLGIPICYPRLNFLENALESKFNPIIALSRTGTMGLGSLANKFNKDAELLDDLNDHWTSKAHKQERNWLVQQFQRLAHLKKIRVTFLSGDVHCAAVGIFSTLSQRGHEPAPAQDFRYMLNVVTSAIVNTPPPPAVIALVSSRANKKHKTLHHGDTDESMLHLFDKDTNGTPNKQKVIMGKRNWCSVQHDSNGDLTFDIRVEITKGHGKTTGYMARAPAPHWSPAH